MNVPLTMPLVMRVAVMCDAGCLAKVLAVYMVQVETIIFLLIFFLMNP